MNKPSKKLAPKSKGGLKAKKGKRTMKSSAKAQAGSFPGYGTYGVQ